MRTPLHYARNRRNSRVVVDGEELKRESHRVRMHARLLLVLLENRGVSFNISRDKAKIVAKKIFLDSVLRYLLEKDRRFVLNLDRVICVITTTAG